MNLSQAERDETLPPNVRRFAKTVRAELDWLDKNAATAQAGEWYRRMADVDHLLAELWQFVAIYYKEQGAKR